MRILHSPFFHYTDNFPAVNPYGTPLVILSTDLIHTFYRHHGASPDPGKSRVALALLISRLINRPHNALHSIHSHSFLFFFADSGGFFFAYFHLTPLRQSSPHSESSVRPLKVDISGELLRSRGQFLPQVNSFRHYFFILNSDIQHHLNI